MDLVNLIDYQDNRTLACLRRSMVYYHPYRRLIAGTSIQPHEGLNSEFPP